VGDKKYKAFISYSHADEAWGAWLQRSLEGFRPPGSLAASLEATGRSARLAPVFRDREDLPVAGNLNSAIKAALADSEFQIVLCSPSAAKSRWVNEEIRLFHKLHGPGRAFALIIGGAPGAAAVPGRQEDECFPPALRFALGPDGQVTDAPAEPLAADARDGGDGKKYALLKIAAGMLGVGLDDLVRRDAARRSREAWTITATSLIGTIAAAALAIYAGAKSNEATLMRGKAENLIEFMLTDLKERLEPVGRLDVLAAVGDRALAYYADQEPKSLSDDALARRAKAVMQLGTIDFRRNDIEAAFEAYLAAETATGELLRRAPNDPDRIFDHAQNVFYVGEAALGKYDRKRGEDQYREYLRLAERLVEIDADNPKWRLELAYATSNLGSLKIEIGDFAAAIPFFASSIDARYALWQAAPDDRKLRLAYAYAISWRAFAELQRGHFRSAAELIRLQLET
jgi:tetratricopeptide (TPR) repeat protein